MKRLWNYLLCLFGGHPCEPTGRHGYLLIELRCTRCGGVYIKHGDYGNALIPASESSDFILVRHMEAIESAKALPESPLS